MPSNSYWHGLEFTLGSVGVACILLILVVVYWGRFTPYHIFAAPLSILVAGLATFALIHPVVNLLVQPGEFSLLGSGEVENGVLGLRISSVLLGAKALLYLESIIWRVVREKAVDMVEWQILSQFAVYLPAVVLLWATLLLGVRSIEVSVLSWAIFFIVDDWLILMYYLAKLPLSDVPRSHRWRIDAFNLLVLVMLPYVINQQFGAVLSAWTSAVLFCFMVIRYLPRWAFLGRANDRRNRGLMRRSAI